MRSLMLRAVSISLYVTAIAFQGVGYVIASVAAAVENEAKKP
jgi:hypothetical protein